MSNHRYAYAGTGPGIGFVEAGMGVVRRLLTAFDAGYERYLQRRALLALSDEQLEDIGITRAEAIIEGSKPFWR
jgi:uncharacterized protein YjiS (DUF1127 family)